MSRSESYVDDIPMRLSRRFEPFMLEESSSLPDVPSHESLMREYTYNFNTELGALEAADRRSKEICDEAERVRQQQLMQQQQQLDRLSHQIQQQPQNPIHPHQHHPVPAPSAVFPSSLQVHPVSHVVAPNASSPSPPAAPAYTPAAAAPVAAQMPHPVPFTSHHHQSVPVVPLPVVPSSSSSSLSVHPQSLPASPLTQVKQLHHQVQVPVGAGSLSSSFPSGNFTSHSATNSVITSSNSIISAPLSAVAMSASSTLNGAANETHTPSLSTNSADHCNSANNAPSGSSMKLKPINTKEFEDFVGSSPFDDALLRSIDDRQELNSVFANVQPPNHNVNNTHFNGPSHSGYNHFTPR